MATIRVSLRPARAKSPRKSASVRSRPSSRMARNLSRVDQVGEQNRQMTALALGRGCRIAYCGCGVKFCRGLRR